MIFGAQAGTGTSTTYTLLPSRTFTVSYGYDEAGNRTSLTDPESGVTNYTYDALNRLVTLSNFQSQIFNFSYDALSRRTQLTRPNGVNTAYTYDNLSRLLSVLHQLSGNTLDGATYTVDPVGNRTAKTNHLSSATDNYTYDAIYQLTQAVQGMATSESYTYDSVGNRLSSLGVSPYSYNSSNQLTALPAATFTYDNNGNTASKTDVAGATSYTWDFENRLLSVTLPSSQISNFKYDPFGRRIQKVSPQGATIYVYDGANIIEEVDAGGAVLARYTQGLGIDEPLAMLRSGVTSYYEADGLGSITSMTDSAGAIAASYTYDSFGNLTASTGTVANAFRYTARELDAETALYFYRARYYDVSVGRFLSEDPLESQGGVNYYVYVANSPIGLTDPYGLFPRSFHGSMTYDLARAIFGGKCEPAARRVADANSKVDDVGDGWDWFPGALDLITGRGEGWEPGGPHFPDAATLEQLRNNAFEKCSLEGLGGYLHSLQDANAHSGLSPFDHYVRGWVPDSRAKRNAGLVDRTMLQTANELRRYRDKCMPCCK